MPAQMAAGLLLYRHLGPVLEVLLIHASGNYNRNKPWGIPKGVLDSGEAIEDGARRETWEETGVRIDGVIQPLGSVRYRKSGKTIHAFAAPAPPDCAPHCASWEIDQAEFLPLDRARQLIHPDQAVFLDRLEALLVDQ